MEINSIEHYRTNREAWTDLGYVKVTSEKSGAHDENDGARYAVILAIQYDFMESDEVLIRFLLEQEIISREQDDFQGASDALWSGCYLLARFKRTIDIPLFYRAKYANFDTSCGFDLEFMFVALEGDTEAYVQKNHPELYEDIEGKFEEMNLVKWWKRMQNWHPDRESDESFHTLFFRAIDADDRKKARLYLDEWKEKEPESKEKDSTLKSAYIDLEEYELAIPILEKTLKEQTTLWDKTSVSTRILELYTKLSDAEKGLEIIKAMDEMLCQFDDWKNTGLGRMGTQAAFEFSSMVVDTEIGKASFEIADGWYTKLSSFMHTGLVSAQAAAEKHGILERMRYFRTEAEEERKRIDEMLG